MKNTAIRLVTILVFLTLIGWGIIRIEEPPTFDQSCLLFIVVLLGLQIFKE